MSAGVFQLASTNLHPLKIHSKSKTQHARQEGPLRPSVGFHYWVHFDLEEEKS
jgi:hypothetical protein